jgi:hypothetical protein
MLGIGLMSVRNNEFHTVMKHPTQMVKIGRSHEKKRQRNN